MRIKRLSIIGLGLIGGSLAHALRQADAVEHIIGCGRSLPNLQCGRDLGVIDSYHQDVGQAVAQADLVFVAAPLGAMRDIFAAMNGQLKTDAIITDGGSAKASVIADFNAVCPQHRHQFVPGHPIAGTENSGVKASFATLYQNRQVILTPTESSSADAIHKVTEMWQLCGAEVKQMTAEHHDQILAATSHLPHMLAFALVDLLGTAQEKQDIFEYTAGGFLDFSRIASSNPIMWRDICLANKTAISEITQQYAAHLQQLAEWIEQTDGEALLEVFQHAKMTRDQLI